MIGFVLNAQPPAEEEQELARAYLERFEQLDLLEMLGL